MRYLRVYQAIWRACLIEAMAHRVNFFSRLFFGVTYIVLAQGVLLVVFTKIDTLAGWRLGDMLIFTGTTYLADLLFMTFFMFNVMDLPNKLNTGRLDLLLTKPLSPQFLVVFDKVNFDMLFSSVLGVALVGYGVWLNGTMPNLGSVVLYVLLVVNGVLVFHCTYLLMTCVAFWQTQSRLAGEITHWLYSFAMKPDVIYQGSLRFILAYVLPALVLVNLPSRVLMGKLNVKEVVAGLLLSLTYFALCQWVWRVALRRYSSASS